MQLLCVVGGKWLKIFPSTGKKKESLMDASDIVIDFFMDINMDFDNEVQTQN